MVSNETSFDGVEWIHWTNDRYRCWAEDCAAAKSYVKGAKRLGYVGKRLLYLSCRLTYF
jgi:hypothetical protein